MLSASFHRLAKKIPQVRRTHCFCLGAAKTGTTSFSAMFETHYRSAHEPEVKDLTETVEKVILKELSDSEIIAWLTTRDRRLNLEIEASHPLGYLAPWLPRAFPEARFVITVREPRAWLRSRLNFHYHKTPAEWQHYRDFIWSRHHKGYSDDEAALEELGLYSLDAYLAQYAEQYRLLFDHLPRDRTLVLNTDRLNTSLDRIASFLKIDASTISQKHANIFSPRDNVIDMLPEAFVETCTSKNCSWINKYLQQTSAEAGSLP